MSLFPSEIRLWPHHACRRQQAHRGFRQGRREESGRQLRRAGVMRPAALRAAATACVASSAGAAPLWTVEKSEIAYLFYGEPGRPVLSISCGQQEGEAGKDATRIEVEVETGTKPGKDDVVLRIEQDKGRKDVPLKPLLCGGWSKCPSQSDGEVYRYVASVPGKSLALDIAGKGRKLAIDAPGAKITAPADPAVFKKFSVSCLNW